MPPLTKLINVHSISFLLFNNFLVHLVTRGLVQLPLTLLLLLQFFHDSLLHVLLKLQLLPFQIVDVMILPVISSLGYALAQDHRLLLAHETIYSQGCLKLLPHLQLIESLQLLLMMLLLGHDVVFPFLILVTKCALVKLWY